MSILGPHLERLMELDSINIYTQFPPKNSDESEKSTLPVKI